METSGPAKATALKNSCQLRCPQQYQPSQNPSRKGKVLFRTHLLLRRYQQWVAGWSERIIMYWRLGHQQISHLVDTDGCSNEWPLPIHTCTVQTGLCELYKKKEWIWSWRVPCCWEVREAEGNKWGVNVIMLVCTYLWLWKNAQISRKVIIIKKIL